MLSSAQSPSKNVCKTAVVIGSLLLLLTIFGISVAKSDDVCMSNAELGINLTWWIGINNFAAFVLVIVIAYNAIDSIWIATFVGALFVPWHVIGFIIFTTTQKSCISDGHAVGVAAVFIFVLDVCLVLTGLVLTFQPVAASQGSTTTGSEAQKPWWKKRTIYIVAAIGVSSAIAMAIGSSYLNDSCLTSDPTGIDLAQWILTLGTVTLFFFVIVTCVALFGHGSRTTKLSYSGFSIASLFSDYIVIALTAIWVVFLIVWIPLGLFLAASTQAACISSSSSGQSALTAGLFFSLLLPIAAVTTINIYTARLWTFQKPPAAAASF